MLLVTQVCDTVDFPQCHCHHVQQVGPVFLWFSISSGPHFMAYVLLLGFGIRGCQDGLRGDYKYELRDIPQVGCSRVKSNTDCAKLVPHPDLNLQGSGAHWCMLCWNIVAGQRCLLVSQRLLHPNAQGMIHCQILKLLALCGTDEQRS